MPDDDTTRIITRKISTADETQTIGGGSSGYGDEDPHTKLYRPRAAAGVTPAAVAPASKAGEFLTEPKANVWFEECKVSKLPKQLQLDRRSRMVYDEKHIFINGESWRTSGADASLMRHLADQRALTKDQLQNASQGAKDLLLNWCSLGWMRAN